jgi:hypothetical protein
VKAPHFVSVPSAILADRLALNPRMPIARYWRAREAMATRRASSCQERRIQVREALPSFRKVPALPRVLPSASAPGPAARCDAPEPALVNSGQRFRPSDLRDIGKAGESRRRKATRLPRTLPRHASRAADRINEGLRASITRLGSR